MIDCASARLNDRLRLLEMIAIVTLHTMLVEVERKPKKEEYQKRVSFASSEYLNVLTSAHRARLRLCGGRYFHSIAEVFSQQLLCFFEKLWLDQHTDPAERLRIHPVFIHSVLVSHDGRNTGGFEARSGDLGLMRKRVRSGDCGWGGGHGQLSAGAVVDTNRIMVVRIVGDTLSKRARAMSTAVLQPISVGVDRNEVQEQCSGDPTILTVPGRVSEA